MKVKQFSVLAIAFIAFFISVLSFNSINAYALTTQERIQKFNSYNTFVKDYQSSYTYQGVKLIDQIELALASAPKPSELDYDSIFVRIRGNNNNTIDVMYAKNDLKFPSTFDSKFSSLPSTPLGADVTVSASKLYLVYCYLNNGVFTYQNMGFDSDTRVVGGFFLYKSIHDVYFDSVMNPDVSPRPSSEDIGNYNFPVGQMRIKSPANDFVIQGSGLNLSFYAKIPYTSSGGTSTNSITEKIVLDEIRSTMTVVVKGNTYSDWKFRSLEFDDDNKTAAIRGWYKVKGEISISSLDDFGLTNGKFSLKIGSNVITGVNRTITSVSYNRSWYSDETQPIFQTFIDNDGDGIDDNTGTHIGQDSENPTNPDNFPQEPTNGSILDYLKYYGEILLWIINIPVNLLKDLVGFLMTTFNNVSSSFSEMGVFFSSFFSFLPGPLAGSLWLVLIAMFITGIIKIVR